MTAKKPTPKRKTAANTKARKKTLTTKAGGAKRKPRSPNTGKGHTQGNAFYLARSSNGRKKIFENADTLLLACIEYFKWADDNPVTKEVLVKGHGDSYYTDERTPRPYSIIGLTMFLHINRSTWTKNYRTHKDFIQVTTLVEDIIRDQKITGAMAGHYNGNIVARDIGLHDTHRVGNPDGEVFETASENVAVVDDVLGKITKDMTDKEAAAIYKQFTSSRRAHT